MLINILKCDLYRLSKSNLLYGIAAFTALIAFALTMMIRQDIRLGLSVFGNLTAFRGMNDIIRIGILYHNGLGIFIAVLLSVFIGQEYQWKTWQHKWMTNKSRAGIYLSKCIISSAGSAAIFLIYQCTALMSSNQIRDIFTGGYAAAIISGLFIYAALGAVICLISMLIKNSTASVIICLLYVLLSETFASVIGNIGGASPMAGRLVGFAVRHSVYGMATIVSSAAFSAEQTVHIVLNALVIILLSALFGIIVFKKYELH